MPEARCVMVALPAPSAAKRAEGSPAKTVHSRARAVRSLLRDVISCLPDRLARVPISSSSPHPRLSESIGNGHALSHSRIGMDWSSLDPNSAAVLDCGNDPRQTRFLDATHRHGSPARRSKSISRALPRQHCRRCCGRRSCCRDRPRRRSACAHCTGRCAGDRRAASGGS